MPGPYDKGGWWGRWGWGGRQNPNYPPNQTPNQNQNPNEPEVFRNMGEPQPPGIRPGGAPDDTAERIADGNAPPPINPTRYSPLSTNDPWYREYSPIIYILGIVLVVALVALVITLLR
jgi:hypothetical protein